LPVRVGVTERAALRAGRRLVRRELAALDRACGPERAGTELSRVHRAAGRPLRVSPLLAELVRVALAVAARTDGRVDPTVGAALSRLRTASRPWLPTCGSALGAQRSTAGWRQVALADQRLCVPPTVLLDLGATATARTAQRCADLLVTRYGGGALVGLGGAVASAGEPPVGGWLVPVDDETVTVPAGAVATSRGVAVSAAPDTPSRSIVDPRTGRRAGPTWRSVTVRAGDCVTAKAFSVAAVVDGAGATPWLAALGLPARLVGVDGTAVLLGGWRGPARAG
jgi:thiamine biosynthesis lipoprotein